MSDYERNKGKLIPFDMTEDVAREFVLSKGETLEYDTYLDQVNDDYTWYCEALAKIGDKFYSVEWEVEREQDAYEFAEATLNKDGSIDFHTYHYNGGAHWTEVVEDALNA